MGTYKKYIDDLEIQKNNLVTTLNNKGVEATNAETLNTLVPKVANIEGAKEEQEKTASASPNGAVIVTPDIGKVLSKVTINTIPTTSQAVPTIAVSSGGLITVTSKQTEGYVKAGTKTPIKQLDAQGAKTITPSTSSQTAVSAYKFTTGAITVAGDANLTAANIKAGTKIFGITGTHVGQKTEQTKTVDLSMASGNQTVTPDSGKVLNKVIVNKPSTLIPDNIKKDVNIGGVVGTLESGGSSSSDEIGKLTINVIQQPTTDEWDLCVCGKTLDDNEIVLNNNNLSAEINIAKNKLFVLYTTLCIDYVETSDWGLFDFVGMSTDYVQNNEYIPTKTYVCYAGNTNTATWNIAFR